ncbi:transporter substrate-binding domain-containing protein [Rummeliibacillus suwonensis]|uniref:transporter substrate-binding domain-containing protein n=1 Tax=Rummeliibacillus suwonensis TaxID=1306154 RepID=UPI001AAFD485|nr:transporter substrate-binding domain-containing protein [Rummeliibacillus suwonensis]MBO2536612.1 transporter substrate-binding domain-containing protein [Rummeliibacillus suwonensis]
MKKKWLFAAAAVLSLSLAGCGSNSDKTATDNNNDQDSKKVLVMGTSADFAPFEYIDSAKSDEIIGFDVDLAKAVTKKMGYQLKIQDMEFNSLIPAVQSKKIDFAMAGITPNEKRAKVVDFTDSYYDTVDYIITKKGATFNGIDDLKGKKIGAQVSSIEEDTANTIKDKLKTVKVETRDRVPELIQEVKLGRLDAIVLEDIVAKNYVKQNNDLKYSAIEGVENQKKAAAFPKGSKLVTEFNKAVKELDDAGEIDKMRAKWFKVE